MLLADNHLAIQ